MISTWAIVVLLMFVVFGSVYYVRWLLGEDELRLSRHKYRKPRRHWHE